MTEHQGSAPQTRLRQPSPELHVRRQAAGRHLLSPSPLASHARAQLQSTYFTSPLGWRSGLLYGSFSAAWPKSTAHWKTWPAGSPISEASSGLAAPCRASPVCPDTPLHFSSWRLPPKRSRFLLSSSLPPTIDQMPAQACRAVLHSHAVRTASAARIKPKPTASSESGRSPSWIQADTAPTTGMAKVLMPAGPAGSR